MDDKQVLSRQQRWALFRLSVISRLLSAPPPRGELSAAIAELAAQEWRHPITGAPHRIGFSTIERWLHRARATPDPVGALRQKVRSDAGEHPSMSEPLRQLVLAQYRDHRSWSYKLHYDNHAAEVRKDPALGPLPSYATVRRYMKAKGLLRQRRKTHADTVAARAADERRQQREMRSFEAEHVGGLWHTDFHCCTRKVLTAGGSWVRPWVIAILDDHSRLACHAQWYFDVCAQNTVHALTQAIAKRGLPRQLMHDNGSEFIAAEVQLGLSRLGIGAEPTMEYCPEQNGKQERWWDQLEGRLVAMLERAEDLSLAQLNLATQAWVELEYHRERHSELGRSPLDRFCQAPSVLRRAPSSADLRLAFGQQKSRSVRRGDGTISLEGQRFEIPARFRHLQRVTVRWARWDLSFVHLIDARTEQVLSRIYPLDKAANADGRRRRLQAVDSDPPSTAGAIAPLLEELIDEYQRDGVPPAYLPKDDLTHTDNPDDKEDSA